MIKNINTNRKSQEQPVIRQAESKPQNVENQSRNKVISMSRDSFAISQNQDCYNNYTKDGDLLIKEQNKEISSANRVSINLIDLIQQKRNERSTFLEMLAENRESAKAQAEAYAEEARRWQIILEIFRRIMRGDKVPKCDEDFLAANSPALFMMAMVARQENENPEEYDSIAPNEDDDGVDYSSSGESSNEGKTSATTSSSSSSSNAQQSTATSG